MGPTWSTWRWRLVAVIALASVAASAAVSLTPRSGEQSPEEPTARPQIVGGHPAAPGEYPFAVSLLRHGVANRFDAAFCGGSLVGPDLVLTAAHCVHGDAPSTIDALVNTNDLRSGGQRIGTTTVQVHPAYDAATSANDVAVLELDRMVEPANLLAVAAPTQEDLGTAGRQATVIGWGTTKTAGYPDTLHEVGVPIIADEDCRANYGRAMIEAVMICAGAANGGRDSCSGDSGGPLIVRDDTSWVQVGVVSWGYGCALPDLPGVYAETAALHDFLAPFLDGLRDLPTWAATEIEWMVDNGYADGYPDRRFRPDQTLTRAQAVNLVHRIADPPSEATIGAAQPFSDVPQWIDDAVRWAAFDPDGDGPESAPMTGYRDGTFRPDDAMNRAEFSRLLWRLAGQPVAARHGFTDVGSWVTGAVSWMVGAGHAEGWPDGTYRPSEPLTRAQAARMLHRIHSGSTPTP